MPAAILAHPFIAAAATAIAGSSAIQASSANTASKSAKSAAGDQMNMARASQDALVAKEAAATADVQKAQETASSQAKATVTNKKRAVARSSNIYTSPLGIGGTADVARKVLLGA